MSATWGYTEVATVAIAAALTTAGLAGFLVTGFDGSAQHADGTLLGFSVDPLHNVVHLATGCIGLLAWGRFRSAMAFGALLLVGFGLAAVDELLTGVLWSPPIEASDAVLRLGIAACGAVIVQLARWELALAEAATLPGDVASAALGPDAIDSTVDPCATTDHVRSQRER